MTGDANLDLIFTPESVAVVGVSTNENQDGAVGNVARIYLDALLRSDFSGRIYPINPKGGEVWGLKVYPNVKDVPDAIDYVICCIPAALAPQLVEDCAVKGVKAVQFFTSGFSEGGTEKGRQLEAEICNLARQGGVRLVGPNCMGVYSPEVGLTFAADFPRKKGAVGFICQSGGNAIYFIRLANWRGVPLSKLVSYGNACDVNESDLLEYLVADPETEIIAAYIEGVKDGKRFDSALREAAKVKPVIVMKGGCTEAGSRAASSHTGSLAGSTEVWNGLIQQAGIVAVPTLEELADSLVTFTHLPVFQGRRLGTIGLGGGATVVATDGYASAGFVLPSLPEELQQKLRSFIEDDAGVSIDNPVDLSSQYNDAVIYSAVRALADYSGIDILVFNLPLGIMPQYPSLPEENAILALDNVTRVHKETAKPMAVVVNQLITGESWETAFACQQKCHEAGIPVYFSIDSAARAIDRFLRFHEHRARLTG